MEARFVATSAELERFKRKAASYKRALELYPNARMLEIGPILAVVDGYIRRMGLKRSEAVVVDLMSGTGFLTKQLCSIGFAHVHAIEACAEMAYDSVAYRAARLHPVPSLDCVEDVLRRIEPDLIVSLAGLHHVIARKDDDAVDRVASRRLQADLIRMCLRCSSARGGVVLIADIHEDDIDEWDGDVPVWAGRTLQRTLDRVELTRGLLGTIRRRGGFRDVTRSMRELLGFEHGRNVSLKWFRDVVASKSPIGHDDVALSAQLFGQLRDDILFCGRYHCPWVFEREEDAAEFVLNKFGFCVDGGETERREEIVPLMKDVLGHLHKGGRAVLGWNLALVGFGRQTEAVNGTVFRINVALGLVNIVLALLVAVRMIWKTSVGLDMTTVGGMALSAFVGFIISELLSALRRRK